MSFYVAQWTESHPQLLSNKNHEVYQMHKGQESLGYRYGPSELFQKGRVSMENIGKSYFFKAAGFMGFMLMEIISCTTCCPGRYYVFLRAFFLHLCLFFVTWPHWVDSAWSSGKNRLMFFHLFHCWFRRNIFITSPECFFGEKIPEILHFTISQYRIFDDSCPLFWTNFQLPGSRVRWWKSVAFCYLFHKFSMFPASILGWKIPFEHVQLGNFPPPTLW